MAKVVQNFEFSEEERTKLIAVAIILDDVIDTLALYNADGVEDEATGEIFFSEAHFEATRDFLNELAEDELTLF